MNEVGVGNIVGIVTANTSNNMVVANTLALIYPNIFWTSYVAYIVNLILASIRKINNIQSVIMMGSVSINIYSHIKFPVHN